MKTLLGRRSPLLALAACAALAATFTGSDRARADEPASADTAQTLFEEGKALAAERRYDEACPKFVESLRQDPGLGTRLWLADCFEKNGQTASAWREFQEAARAAASRRDDRERVARKRAASLEERLTRVSLRLAPDGDVDGLEVRRDGILVETAELGTALPVDPGVHLVAVRAPGHQPWTTMVDIAQRATTTTINLPRLAPVDPEPQDPDADALEPDPAPAPAPVAAPRTPSPPPSRASGPSPFKVGAIAAGAASAIATGIGAYLAYEAKDRYTASNRDGHCTSASICDAVGKGLRNHAYSEATEATVMLSAGAATILGAGLLWFLAPRSGSGSERTRSVAFTPAFDARGGALFLGKPW